MRRHFSIPRYNREAFDWPEVVPDALEHHWPGDDDTVRSAGGTDFLATGKPGSGKSTLALYWAIRQLEVNDEIVVWRADESRSEWIPLAPWARVCLPAGVDVTARVKSKVPGAPAQEVDVEEVAREVVRYDDVRDLNQSHLTPGMFHVVYPDPTFAGCQEVYEDSPKTYDLEFVQGDPAKHWWIAWALDRVENGPYHFTSLMFDEVGDVVPQGASKDDFSTYEKVELFRDVYVDARKFGLSFFMFGHSEVDVHEMLRRKVRWRITMNGVANPTSAGQVVGMNTVPMRKDLTSHMNVGRALMWTETRFDHTIAWKDVPAPTQEVLEVRTRPPEAVEFAQEGGDDRPEALTDGGRPRPVQGGPGGDRASRGRRGGRGRSR